MFDGAVELSRPVSAQVVRKGTVQYLEVEVHACFERADPLRVLEARKLFLAVIGRSGSHLESPPFCAP